MSKINWKFYRPYRDKLVDKKNENEVMLQVLKTVLANPKSMQSLITLGKFVKDQEE